MLFRTHLVLGFLGGFLLMPLFEHQIVFLMLFLVGSVFPDIDSKFSKVGNKKFLRPFQFFVSHRGIVHSLFFILIIGIILWSFFYLEVYLGFILGFFIHLFIDGLTPRGVKVFYPFEFKFKGKLKTGGYGETTIFVFSLVISLFLIFNLIFV